MRAPDRRQDLYRIRILGVPRLRLQEEGIARMEPVRFFFGLRATVAEPVNEKARLVATLRRGLRHREHFEHVGLAPSAAARKKNHWVLLARPEIEPLNEIV